MGGGACSVILLDEAVFNIVCSENSDAGGYEVARELRDGVRLAGENDVRSKVFDHFSLGCPSGFQPFPQDGTSSRLLAQE